MKEQWSRTTRKQRSYVWGALLVLMAIFVVSKVMFAAYQFVANFDPKSLVFAMGADLEKDEHGYTNILLLGDGGHERDGADLIDTIMVVSIDYEGNAISMVSIPRDYYVKEDVIWPGKINELYRNHKRQLSEEERFDLFRKVVGKIVNLDIPYYLRADFSGFVEVVDSLGGVTIDVEKEIDDPYYPNETDNGYTLFHVPAGVQEMDGETALKYVRSRKTTSDFDRAARQQKMLEAIREKALSKDVLTDTGTLKKMYGVVEDNINTNLSLREMIALAGFASRFDRNRLVRKVIHDDPGQDGGFLYTPERKYYNDLFVLVPFGDNLDLIHKYTDLIFHHRDALIQNPTIEVLNATKVPGIARNAAYQLNRFGFNVVSIDNYFDDEGEKKFLDESVIFYYDWTQDRDNNVIPDYKAAIDALLTFVRAIPMPGDPVYADQGVDISIVLGKDYEVYAVN